jgi:hypothetical protein
LVELERGCEEQVHPGFGLGAVILQVGLDRALDFRKSVLLAEELDIDPELGRRGVVGLVVGIVVEDWLAAGSR